MRRRFTRADSARFNFVDPSNTRSQEAFDRIRQDIIGSKLAPGEKLRIADLKARYGVGASPLREALSRLVSEGLVAVEGQRGFWVPSVSREEYVDIVKTRIVLEVCALRESIAHGDTEWEGQIAATYHKLSRVEHRVASDPEAHLADWWERNRLFHEALIAACPLQWVLHFDRIVFDLHNRYHRLTVRGRDFSPDLFEDHRLIKQATLDRDADRAAMLLETHILRPPAPDFPFVVGSAATH